MQINEIAKELRPIGRVRAILKSPAREKELLITLLPVDRELLDIDNLNKL
jgi:hypothetical protein